eukprot:m.102711 g.102711  ORF g.102711 m.102711 type:complete len:507 (+) comp13781_c0_seq1:196-1716(+)
MADYNQYAAQQANQQLQSQFDQKLKINVPEFVPQGYATQTTEQLSVSAPSFQPGMQASQSTFKPDAPVFNPSINSPEFTPSMPVPSQKAMAPTGHLAHYDKVSELAYAQRPPKTYPSLLPHAVRQLQPNKHAPGNSLFVDEDLRQGLIKRQIVTEMTYDKHTKDVPAEVDNYHSFVDLEPLNLAQGTVFGYPSVVYKAFSMADGLPYAVRRIAGYRLSEAKAIDCVNSWKNIRHSNIVNLREAFTTRDFQDHSVCFIYDFHPLSETLLSRHFQTNQGFVSEELLWSYIIQITSALRAVHLSGLACRVIHPSKILVSAGGKNTRSHIRIGSVCVLDVLQYSEQQQTHAVISHYQQEDLVALGKLILVLACSNLRAVTRENLPQSFQYVSKHYTEHVYTILRYLLGANPHGPKNLNDLMPMIGARFYTELESEAQTNTSLEHELAKELQNGRLFRLATKLQMVIGRPEQELDPRWADTGDRFLLKLLQHYIFHRVSCIHVYEYNKCMS